MANPAAYDSLKATLSSVGHAGASHDPKMEWKIGANSDFVQTLESIYGTTILKMFEMNLAAASQQFAAIFENVLKSFSGCTGLENLKVGTLIPTPTLATSKDKSRGKG